MSIKVHWYLPTAGDGRTLVQAGAAVQARRDSRRGDDQDGSRRATLDYLVNVATVAEEEGFDAVLTPTGTWCDDAWITTALVSQRVPRLGFIVAFRPGTMAPMLAAQQAVTFQRHTEGRLLLNVVTGGDDKEQRRYGDDLKKAERYARTDEFLTIVRNSWQGEPFDFSGEFLWADGAVAFGQAKSPPIYFGGASPAALSTAARHADVYLTWGDPPTSLAPHLRNVHEAAEAEGRELRVGIRLHVVARSTAEEAWQAADALLADADDEMIAAAQRNLSVEASLGQQRMVALHGGKKDRLEVYPNLWAGIGLLRGGAGTALVGSFAEVAERIGEYHDLGIEEFIFSGYPHDEEARVFGSGVMPELRARGLLHESRPAVPLTTHQ